MEKLEERIVKMQGVFNCLFVQGRINKPLHSYLLGELTLIYQASQLYTKPKVKASFSEVEEYVNKHINMADTMILEAELERRRKVGESLKP